MCYMSSVTVTKYCVGITSKNIKNIRLLKELLTIKIYSAWACTFLYRLSTNI